MTTKELEVQVEALNKKTDGLINAIRNNGETLAMQADLIRQLREDLDKERTKVRQLELKLDNITVRLQSPGGAI